MTLLLGDHSWITTSLPTGRCLVAARLFAFSGGVSAASFARSNTFARTFPVVRYARCQGRAARRFPLLHSCVRSTCRPKPFVACFHLRCAVPASFPRCDTRFDAPPRAPLVTSPLRSVHASLFIQPRFRSAPYGPRPGRVPFLTFPQTISGSVTSSVRDSHPFISTDSPAIRRRRNKPGACILISHSRRGSLRSTP